MNAEKNAWARILLFFTQESQILSSTLHSEKWDCWVRFKAACFVELIFF